MKTQNIVSLVAAAFLACLLLFVPESAGRVSAQRPLPPNEPLRGLIYDGLEIAPAVCRELYRIRNTDSCTHGPDPAPRGLNVKESVAPLDFGGQPYTPRLVCDGDGTSGKRTQVLYVRASDRADRYNTYLSTFQSIVAQVDSIYNDSAAETGGARRVRFVHDGSCVPIIPNVQLSPFGDDTFDNTINELQALGYNRADRKYILFVDADVYCGIATFGYDDQPGAANSFNSGPYWGRNDSGCWDAHVVAHEHMHNMGAVQNSAPHSTYHQGSFAHCTDDYDVMCYRDAPGVIVSIVCPDPAHDDRFDCNHDDYFHTNPPSGNYLATHWNTANNEFLIFDASPPPGGGVELCDGSNYGAPCQRFTYTSNNTCIYLGAMDNKANSIRFRDEYIGAYDAIVYGDNACSVYNARYDHDVPDFGLANDNYSSMRLERRQPSGGVELCDGSNYGSPCQTFTWNGDNNACLGLGSMDNKANSIRFLGTYVGDFDAIVYGDNGCGVYNARYDHDVPDFGLANDNYSSMRLERHQPPQPPGAPHTPVPADGTAFGSDVLGVNVAFQGDGDQFRVHAWGNNYDYWSGWGANRNVWLNNLTGQTYSWQAQARNSVGESPWSPQWTFTIQAPPPSNDTFSAATLINNTPYNTTQDTSAATTATDDPNFACVTGQKYATVWYKFTPPSNGTITADTIGSNYDTVLGVWTGSQGALTSVACDDDSGGNSASRVTNVNVNSGVTYYIEIAAFASGLANEPDKPVDADLALAGGNLQFAMNFTSGPTIPPTPTLLSPPSGHQSRARSRVLDWTDSAGATRYEVEVRRGSRTGTIVVSTSVTPSTFTTPRLTRNYWYWWKVRACATSDASSCSPWTTQWKFKVLP